MSTTPPKTALLRLSGLRPSQLPPPTTAGSTPPDQLAPFLAKLLSESLPFIDSAAPRSGLDPEPSIWKPKGTKKVKAAKAAAAVVRLSERELDLAEGGAETWACRTSVHDDSDAAGAGSASWAEFARDLRDDHVRSEEAYTPAVVAQRTLATWDVVGGVGEMEGGAGGGQTWRARSMALVEMKHRLPAPLRPRVFVVLQVVYDAGAGADDGGGGGGGDEFVVVSVPVVGDERAVLSREAGVVVGAYASVERVRKMAKTAAAAGSVGGGGGGGGGKGKIEWVMATASDARGVLPLWVQAKAVVGEVAKDVGMYLEWVDGERRRARGG